MKSYRVAYVWHIPLCRMSYVIHIPSCRYKYVIDICPYVSQEMDLAHICKSTDLNMQIYRMEYANLQDWICTSTQSNMTFYRVAYVWHIPLCRMSYVIHIPSCRGWIASVAQALSSQCLDEGPSPLHWPSWCTVRRCSFYFRPRQHVDCLTSALLLMHFAPTECSSGSIQQFIRRHPPLSSFFWCLWRPSASHHWHHGKKGSQNWLRKLYEPSPVPTLYVGRVEDVLGRVPLSPCFLDGNLTSTIPHKYAARQGLDFEFGCADRPLQGSRRGSHVYEVNTWLWNFGRPQPRVAGLSVAATQKIRKRCRGEAAKAAWKTRQARKSAAAEAQVADDIWQAYTWYIPVETWDITRHPPGRWKLLRLCWCHVICLR
jgi:hypothetical protein